MQFSLNYSPETIQGLSLIMTQEKTKKRTVKQKDNRTTNALTDIDDIFSKRQVFEARSKKSSDKSLQPTSPSLEQPQLPGDLSASTEGQLVAKKAKDMTKLVGDKDAFSDIRGARKRTSFFPFSC